MLGFKSQPCHPFYYFRVLTWPRASSRSFVLLFVECLCLNLAIGDDLREVRLSRKTSHVSHPIHRYGELPSGWFASVHPVVSVKLLLDWNLVRRLPNAPQCSPIARLDRWGELLSRFFIYVSSSTSNAPSSHLTEERKAVIVIVIISCNLHHCHESSADIPSIGSSHWCTIALIFSNIFPPSKFPGCHGFLFTSFAPGRSPSRMQNKQKAHHASD